MTVEELRQQINKHFDIHGTSVPHPETLEVDAETYANVCQFVFRSLALQFGQFNFVKVLLGKNKGILFKGIELILNLDLRGKDYK